MRPDTYDHRVLKIGTLLEQRLEDLGTFHVHVEPYGFKDEPGIRISIVDLAGTGKSRGQVLTLRYRRSKVLKRRPEQLVTGPFGQVKRILKEKEKGGS